MLELEPGFCKWLCKQVQELDESGQHIIALPFRPRNDEQTVIYIDRHDGKARIHDDGETLGTIFVDTGMDKKGFSEMQKDYFEFLASLNGVKADGIVFYIEIDGDDDEGINKAVLNLVQFIVQVSNIDALQEPPKEVDFATRVFKKIGPKIKELRRNFIFDFGSIKRVDDRPIRKVDYFKENGSYLLGRALFSKVNFDKVITTWTIIEEIASSHISSSQFRPRKDIEKATICNSDFKDAIYIEMLRRKGEVFFFPKDLNDIVDFFNKRA